MLPPSNSDNQKEKELGKILSFRTKGQEVNIGRIARGKPSHDRSEPVARLEAELIIRTSALRTENDDLRGRIEVLERCLKIITDNLQEAKDMFDNRGNRR